MAQDARREGGIREKAGCPFVLQFRQPLPKSMQSLPEAKSFHSSVLTGRKHLEMERLSLGPFRRYNRQTSTFIQQSTPKRPLSQSRYPSLYMLELSTVWQIRKTRAGLRMAKRFPIKSSCLSCR